jgi:hypothetical protein
MKNQRIKSNWMKFLLLVLLAMLLYWRIFIAYSKEKIEIEYNLTKLNLDSFAQEDSDVLFDYLTKSSEWHVFPFSGTTIAARRIKSKTCHPVKTSFPDLNFIGIIAYNREPFLNSYRDVSVDLNGSNVNESKYYDKNILAKIGLFKYYFDSSKQKDIFASNLTIESENKRLILNANEMSEDMYRTETTNFLYDVKQQLEKLARHSLNRNVDLSILPYNSYVLSNNSIFLVNKSQDSLDLGVYNISGYVNEGEKGFVSIKVISRSNDEKIQDSGFKESADVEFVGWSNNPEQKFNFCLAVKLGARYPTPETAEAEFQVWFKPANSNKERMLFSQIKTVKIWVDHGLWQR